MTKIYKDTGRAESMQRGLIKSLIFSMIITLAGITAVTSFVNTELMKEQHIGYAIMVVIIAATYFGEFIAWRKVKHRKMLVCLSAGIIYFGCLILLTALFFGGKLEAVGETALLIMCGSMLACITGRR